MRNENSNSDQPVQLYLSKEEYNHLLETIDLLAKVDMDNRVTGDAARLRETLLRFVKKERRTGDDRAAVILYKREACPLIKLLLFYIAAFRKIEPRDYYAEIRKGK